jgi:hypothetical protein
VIDGHIPNHLHRIKAKMTATSVAEMLDHCRDIEPGTNKTRGEITLNYLFKAEPHNFARLITSLLPRHINIEHTD